MITISNKQISIVVGGAGFIGTNLIPHLVTEGKHVVAIDNMSRGNKNFIFSLPQNILNSITLLEGNCNNLDFIIESFRKILTRGNSISEVWHLAANSDIPAGIEDPNIDLNDTFMTTFYLLQAMNKFNIRVIHFASSSAIYGDLGPVVLHESIGPLLPISNYGAMKLASEAFLSASAESFLDRVNLFRFPNVVGIPATHGVILDFINKLVLTPDLLNVLGDGTQQKPYLHVYDLISAMFRVRAQPLSSRVCVVNIGPIDSGVTVRWIAEKVVERVSPSAQIKFGFGSKGWVGDVSKFSYSTDKLQSYGWRPQMNSAEAVSLAIDQIASQLYR